MTELRHPNIVRFLSHGHTNCVYYFVMEYVAGGDLGSLLRRLGHPLPEAQAVSIALQAAEGLAWAHAKGYVHRDLKPGDILLAESAGGWTAKIGDFGLAKSLERAGFSSGSLSRGGSRPEDYGFTPRERLTDYRLMTPASDVFALGAILYHMLTGRSAYEFSKGENPVQTVLDGKVVKVSRAHPEMARPLAGLLERCLAAESAWRYRDGGELAQALKAYA